MCRCAAGDEPMPGGRDSRRPDTRTIACLRLSVADSLGGATPQRFVEHKLGQPGALSSHTGVVSIMASRLRSASMSRAQ